MHVRFMTALADTLLALLGGAAFVEAAPAGRLVALEEVASAQCARFFFWETGG